jgi:hypothetical protein
MRRPPHLSNPEDMRVPLHYSGWGFTDAKNNMTCPKCDAQPGSDCQTPSGRRAWPPHIERTQALIDEYGFTPWSSKRDMVNWKRLLT